MGTGIGKYCKRCGEQLNYDDGFEEGFCNRCYHIVKQEEWREGLDNIDLMLAMLQSIENCTDEEVRNTAKAIREELDKVSQLLSERTFSKEELYRLSIWSGDIGAFGIVSKEDAELINKIYKLLDEENEHIKTHKKFSKLAKKQKELGERLKEILDRNSWEEEVYDGDDYSMVEYFDKETITKELIDFISQLLSERTFSKEELELILYNINYNDGDEVIYLADDEEVGKLKSKIYNLLREKE